MLASENFKEFIFTIVIIAMDLAVAICLLVSGIQSVRKEGSGLFTSTSLVQNWTKDGAKANKESCKAKGKNGGTYADMQMYVAAFIFFVIYVIALILGIVKLFKSQWSCCAGIRWILIIIARVIMIIIAICATACNKYFI